MTSCSQHYFGFLDCFFVCQHVENHPGFLHSPLRRDPYVQRTFAVNPHGFLGTNEGHVNTSSRADISRSLFVPGDPTDRGVTRDIWGGGREKLKTACIKREGSVREKWTVERKDRGDARVNSASASLYWNASRRK